MRTSIPGFSKLIHEISLICFIIMMLHIVSPVFSQQGSRESTFLYTLIPPGNCEAINVECAGYFTWDQPDSLGNMPPGILGYNFYRNGNLLLYIPDPGINYAYDFSADPGIYQYSVTAWYELSPYGFPGQYGESAPCLMDSIVYNCYQIMPFEENWNQGNFYFYSWQFQPSQGNWSIKVDLGNPWPSAAFEGLPTQTSYEYTLRSDIFYGLPYTCADLSFAFDYMLQDIAASGSEHLEMGVVMNDTVFPCDTLSNTGTTGWIHKEVDIDQVGGFGFKVYFRAFGANSLNITRWLIDNILVSYSCRPVTDLDYSLNGNIVHLTWEHPCDTNQSRNSVPAGYNVYRTDETGQPPFLKLNNGPVVVRNYTDTLPSVAPNAQYRYLVTTVFDYEFDNRNPVCESPGDTLLVVPPAGIDKTKTEPFTILPNPGHGLFTLQMSETPESIEVFNIRGMTILHRVIPKGHLIFTFDLTGHPCGVYFLRVNTYHGPVVIKIIKI